MFSTHSCFHRGRGVIRKTGLFQLVFAFFGAVNLTFSRSCTIIPGLFFLMASFTGSGIPKWHVPILLDHAFQLACFRASFVLYITAGVHVWSLELAAV